MLDTGNPKLVNAIGRPGMSLPVVQRLTSEPREASRKRKDLDDAIQTLKPYSEFKRLRHNICKRGSIDGSAPLLLTLHHEATVPENSRAAPVIHGLPACNLPSARQLQTSTGRRQASGGLQTSIAAQAVSRLLANPPDNASRLRGTLGA